LEDKSAHIVGHIDSETPKKWLDWDLGELFVVAFEGGTVVLVYWFRSQQCSSAAVSTAVALSFLRCASASLTCG